MPFNVASFCFITLDVCCYVFKIELDLEFLFCLRELLSRNLFFIFKYSLLISSSISVKDCLNPNESLNFYSLRDVWLFKVCLFGEWLIELFWLFLTEVLKLVTKECPFYYLYVTIGEVDTLFCVLYFWFYVLSLELPSIICWIFFIALLSTKRTFGLSISSKASISRSVTNWFLSLLNFSIWVSIT